MKYIIISLSLSIFICCSAFSQIQVDSIGNVGVGISLPTTKLDVDGKLRVRDVTLDNTKDSILVTSGNGTVSYRDASTLGATACGFSIGDSTAGGIIFYLEVCDCHGLVAKATDEPGSYLWSTTNFDTWAFAGGIFEGAQNTKKIIFINGVGNSPAADVCDNLSYAGYTDWYLPSKDELDMMFANLHTQGLGSFASNSYWSSTEFTLNFAWIQYFNFGNQANGNKAISNVVRAVRAF